MISAEISRSGLIDKQQMDREKERDEYYYFRRSMLCEGSAKIRIAIVNHLNLSLAENRALRLKFSREERKQFSTKLRAKNISYSALDWPSKFSHYVYLRLFSSLIRSISCNDGRLKR